MKKLLAAIAIIAVVATVFAAGVLSTTTPLTSWRTYNANTALEFQVGTINMYQSNAGLSTNAFATAFNAVPAVFVTPLNATTNVTGTMIGYCATNIVGVIPGLTTTSNFVYAAGNTNTYSLQYIAIGQP